MTRNQFTRRIAESYAAFAADVEAHHPDGKPTPLDREWAFNRGREIIAAGDYKPRVSALDYTSVAAEARRQLPAARAFIARVHASEPSHRCAACGATIHTEVKA